MGERPKAISGICNYPPLLKEAKRVITCPDWMDKSFRQKDKCSSCPKASLFSRKVESDFFSAAEKLVNQTVNEILRGPGSGSK